MQKVDIFVGTSLRGPARGTGKVVYILKTTLKNGKEHESAPEAAEYGNATESSLVLHALRDAMCRLNYACEVVLHTECNYVSFAIGQHWPEGWQENAWRNSRGEEVKEAPLWRDILQELEETGHSLAVEPGKHEFTDWMQFTLKRINANKDAFSKMTDE